MARIFMDGWEHGGTSILWNDSYSVYAQTPVFSGMSGTYYLELGTGASYVEKTLVSSKTELYFAFKYYLPTSTSAQKCIMTFRDSDSTIISTMMWNYTNKCFSVKLGDLNSSTIVTGTMQLLLGKTYLIEIRYKPLNSGGVFTTKIDGVQDINYSGDTTAGLENIKIFRIGSQDGSWGSCYIDDVVVDDANWIGNTKVGGIIPNATGTTNNWTASTGTAYQCVDEVPASDTDYVYSNTVNQIATYGMATISSMNTVKAVQLQARAAYEGSPTPLHIQLGVRSGGADYFDTDISPGVGLAWFTKMLELNPADAAAWEQADIDAIEVGVKATA